MSARLRSAGLIAVTILTVTSLVGCGNNQPVPTAGVSTTRSSGGGGMPGGREVKFALDGPGGIRPGGQRSINGVVEEMPAIVEFTGGQVVVERARVLLNDKEVAKVPEDAKVVAVDYTGGILTINADDTKVYEAKLSK